MNSSAPLRQMNTKLVNHVMSDGSRQFAALPQTKLWYELRDHLMTLPGLALTDFLCNGITELG